MAKCAVCKNVDYRGNNHSCIFCTAHCRYVKCTRCGRYLDFYNICKCHTVCFRHCDNVLRLQRLMNVLGVYVSMPIITYDEIKLGVTGKMDTTTNDGSRIDVEFTFVTSDGFIEKQLHKDIPFADYKERRAIIVGVMSELGHKPYVYSKGTNGAGGSKGDKMYVWLDGVGEKILLCQDQTCKMKTFYSEGKQRNDTTKYYFSIRCEGLVDFTSESEKKRHTNWYWTKERLSAVDISTGVTFINKRKKEEVLTVKVVLPDEGQSQHDAAKLEYGEDGTAFDNIGVDVNYDEKGGLDIIPF